MSDRVCPKCGYGYLRRIATHCIVEDYLIPFFYETADSDYDLDERTVDQTALTKTTFDCSECGYKYKSDDPYKIIKEEMIAKEDFKNE